VSSATLAQRRAVPPELQPEVLLLSFRRASVYEVRNEAGSPGSETTHSAGARATRPVRRLARRALAALDEND
jgi:hypothetical protein